MTNREAQTTRENSLGWMIQRVSLGLNTDMTACLQPLGLTLQQFAVMMVVLEQGGQSQNEIGKRFGAPAYTVSRALDTLENLGYVERRADPASRRAHGVFPTAAGIDLAPQLYSVVKGVNTRFAAPLDSDETRVFKQLLARVLAHQIENP